jgi:hypothetical protein
VGKWNIPSLVELKAMEETGLSQEGWAECGWEDGSINQAEQLQLNSQGYVWEMASEKPAVAASTLCAGKQEESKLER